MTLTRPPQRLLYIASIGNPAPYRKTRHSAGHILLDSITPLLRARLGPSASHLYTTFYSPSLMNISGPKVVSTMQKWLAGRDNSIAPDALPPAVLLSGLDRQVPGSPASSSGRRGFPATLVILHDELEAPLGKIRVKRGGPESASLRGHRGLISVLETLRGKGLFPGSGAGSVKTNVKTKTRLGKREGGLPRELEVLRVGIGIGRPAGREKDAVANYVLKEMEGRELDAVSRAAESVVDVLEEEMCRVG
ncbi:hypothetical protein N7539_009446 [Penicillium diatomitis]|uniref:Peptidyl-tRNA hydrolase n=1 Tax=Penicillium diatomitis TaxID=2819901 RepID=A0A9W9WL43_9EURO|nr:uncharacterized protein N7539_009446 [Penicillium diatomitis]KAJ5466717.1 hypothetical protein N7539_009446 [Penicillium diatomitis]